MKFLISGLFISCRDCVCERDQNVLEFGSVTGTNLLSVHMGNFCAVENLCPVGNPRKTTKMVEHRLASFAAVVALWTLVT